MEYSNFVGQVQHRAKLDSEDKAIRAIRATLETLAQRLSSDEVKDAAAQLPQEIARFMEGPDGSERFGVDEFFKRVSDREDADITDAAFHARAVIEVLGEAVSQGEMNDIRQQLPEEFTPLFESGSTGKLE